MMRIIVMSDSHGDTETVKAVAALPADAHFHCGDSELAYENPVFGEMVRIRGNCDKDMTFMDSICMEIDNKNILAVHGHHHNVNHSLINLFYEARENDANIVLFGHTHLFGAEMKEDILFVNPGSTMFPRGGKQSTYAIIEWGDELTVTFKNMKHEVVESIKLKRL